jgi:hypothetical protein
MLYTFTGLDVLGKARLIHAGNVPKNETKLDDFVVERSFTKKSTARMHGFCYTTAL